MQVWLDCILWLDADLRMTSMISRAAPKCWQASTTETDVGIKMNFPEIPDSSNCDMGIKGYLTGRHLV